MKFYVAARFGLKDRVREIYQMLRDKGHEITADWTLHRPIKPYENNPEISQEYSREDVNGARLSDVFLLLSDEAGTGMYVELGVAILSHMERGRPKIYVVGPETSRSMFYFHPAVNRRRTIEEVFEEIEKS